MGTTDALSLLLDLDLSPMDEQLVATSESDYESGLVRSGSSTASLYSVEVDSDEGLT